MAGALAPERSEGYWMGEAGAGGLINTLIISSNKCIV